MTSIWETVSKKIAFRRVGKRNFDLHFFAAGESRNSRKIIVFFSGSGSGPEQFFPHCNHLSQKGYVCVSVDYRGNNEPGPMTLATTLIGFEAIKLIMEHSSEFRFDPRSVIFAGGSAGGHLASCAALAINREHHNTRPLGTILFNPPLNIVSKPHLMAEFGNDLQRFSPYQAMTEEFPATLIFHGTADRRVSYHSIEQFVARGVELGIDIELVGFEGKGHAFFNYGKDGNKPYRRTLEKMERFLSRLPEMIA